ADYLESAVVDISRIELLPLDGSERIVITEAAGTYDLLTLQNGVTADLGATSIPAGTYHELRMVVESAELTLKDGYEFEAGGSTQTLHVPSGSESGIKVKLRTADGDEQAGIEIRPGETVLVVDFDVSQNFVIQGDAETPAGIRSYSFTPVLRAIVADVAGSIAGTVSAPEGVVVEGLQVRATRAGATPDKAPVATALVGADATFLIPFIAPGTYDVTLTAPDGHVANTMQVVVGEDQDVTGVGLAITAAS
ncbi:MAG: DUF4382 domain-containing protein, partial [Longimicrobiales bacterium]